MEIGHRVAEKVTQLVRKPWLRKTAIWSAAAIGLFAIAGFLIAPPIVRHELERVLTDKLQRKVSIERVRINPFAASAAIYQFAVKERDGSANALAFDELYVNLAYSSLVRRALLVESLHLVRPYLRIVRNEDKTYNFQDLIDAAASGANQQAAAAPSPPPRFALFNIEVSDGRIDFDDRPEKTQHAITELRIGVPFISSRPGQVDIRVQPELRAKINGAPFALTGETKPFKDTHETTLHVDLNDLQIAKYLEYSPVPLQVRAPSGRLDAKLVVSLATQENQLKTLTVAGTADLHDLVLQAADGAPLLTLGALQVDLGSLDLVARNAIVKSVKLQTPEINLVRRKDGHINLLGIVSGADLASSADHETQASAPFAFAIGALTVAGGKIKIADEVPAKAFQFTLNDVSLSVEDFVQGQGAAAALDAQARAPNQAPVQASNQAPPKPAAVRLNFATEPNGRFVYDGTLQLAPLRSAGQVSLESLRLSDFAAYYEGLLNVRVASGLLATKGALTVEQSTGRPVRVAYRGQASIANFASLDRATARDLLRWKSLSLKGIDFKLEPFALKMDQVALSDFYSRLIVNPDGRLNLQNLLSQPGAAANKDAAAAAPDATPTATSSAAVAAAPATTEAQSPAAAPPRPREPRSAPLNLSIGKVILAGGKINFSDYFIKPNYSADLTGVAGNVSEMAPGKAGTVELRGLVSQTAPIEILGKVDPFASDLLLDISASARDIELPPLTPYAVKYAGYGIEKGKLSLRIKYLIENGKLTAENNIRLDQLTFGEKVESPTAIQLPVLLAVSLLKDRNGVIEMDVPISGSLDDPQFSLGPVIGRVIVNLITKAITAPFSLLGSLFGGGEELAYLEFAPGTSQLGAELEPKLQSLAKLLENRPGVRIDISGRVEPGADRPALQRLRLERRVKEQKLKAMPASKADAAPLDAVALDRLTLDPADYAKFLTVAYRDAKFARPRNAIGLLKDLPVPEMEQLMLANTPVGDEDLRQLANARAQGVLDWLVQTAGIPEERVFLVAARLDAEGIKDKGRPTRVDFAIR